MTDSNPLLTGAVPDLSRIAATHVEPAIDTLLEELQGEREALEAAGDATWAATVEPLEALQDRLEIAWGAVKHLLSVRNHDALRAAVEAAQPRVVEFLLDLEQSTSIYERLQAIRDGGEWSTLDPGRQRIVRNLIRDARLSGVGLADESRARFREIASELAALATRFSNNVIDATRAFALDLRDPAEVEGLPRSALELAAQAARAGGEEAATPEDGPWRITLDAPSLIPFLCHARRRDLRERLYRAHVTRASSGEHDNTAIIERVLALRAEQARLLGYSTYPEVSLATKMAGDVTAVDELLDELADAAVAAARSELEEIRALAHERGVPSSEPIELWDVAYWAERLREARFDLTDDEVRPYFPLPRVLDGLFDLAGRLFGVRIEAADGEAPVWHDDVRFFRVRDEEGQALAAFYLDPYSRPAEKRGGAWMNGWVGRRRGAGRDGGLREPVAVLVCNQTPPVGERPSCMSFDEVTTLFHEFGHGLQHMLTRVDDGFTAGIRGIEWDAVELPSQFMENWCYETDTLRAISAHVDTGAALPDGYIDSIRCARTFRSGSSTMRQLGFARIDLELHHRYRPGGEESALEVARRVTERCSVLPPLPEDRFLCSFGHIFAGGYAAGYYSYKWAEVLSADAFAAFEEADLTDEERVRATGRRFRDTVLALGGSRPAMMVFEAFRGREPTPQALLRHSGLAAGAA